MTASMEVLGFVADSADKLFDHFDFATQQGVLEFAAGLAEGKFMHDGEVEPLFIFVGPTDTEPALVQVTWANNADKDSVCRMLRACFKGAGARRYAMISECWVATVEVGEEELLAIPPSDRNDRQEIVQVMACEPGHEPLMRTYDIVRELDKPPILMVRPDAGYEAMGGRMMQILD